MEDYKRFALVSMAVSVFLYLGTVIPSIEKTDFTTNLLMIGTFVLLLMATTCFFTARRCHRALQDHNDSPSA